MIHHIKTAVGISTEHITYNKLPNNKRYIKSRNDNDALKFYEDLGRVGQGGGGSPVMWLVMMIVMINVYNIFAMGARIRNAATNMKLEMSLLSYVDNITLIYSPPDGQDYNIYQTNG